MSQCSSPALVDQTQGKLLKIVKLKTRRGINRGECDLEYRKSLLIELSSELSIHKAIDSLAALHVGGAVSP
jgi:hypothetical protein